MQKTNTEGLRRYTKGIYHKTLVNFRFIALLILACLVQQFSFATQENTFHLTNLSAENLINSYYEKGTAEHHESQLDLFIEAESEDEDEVHNEQVYLNGILPKNQTCNTLQYNHYINTLFLRLASTNLHKVELPYFILYHSWKSHLS
jgi:hypothetical protein